MIIYTFVGMFSGLIDDVQIFTNELDAITAWEQYTEFSWKDFVDADSVIGLLKDSKNEGSTIYSNELTVNKNDVRICGFSISDVKSIRHNLTDEQALHVLEKAEAKMDFDVGVNWGVLQSWITQLYPSVDFTIEILSHDKAIDLNENSHWVKYECRCSNGNVVLVSWVIAKNNHQDKTIQSVIENHIAKRGGIDKFPTLGVLNKSLVQLISDCHDSDNDMLFIEKDDEDVSEYDRNAIQNDIEQWNLGEYIKFNEDDAYITVYGGITSAINWQYSI